jgi:hypothetical protein
VETAAMVGAEAEAAWEEAAATAVTAVWVADSAAEARKWLSVSTS